MMWHISFLLLWCSVLLLFVLGFFYVVTRHQSSCSLHPQKSLTEVNFREDLGAPNYGMAFPTCCFVTTFSYVFLYIYSCFLFVLLIVTWPLIPLVFALESIQVYHSCIVLFFWFVMFIICSLCSLEHVLYELNCRWRPQIRFSVSCTV